MLVNLNETMGDNVPAAHLNNNNNNRPAFTRGEKSSASVRLRTKKSENPVNPGNGKKRNRHSGDFSFFSSKSEQQPNTSVSPTRGGAGEVKKGGDWAYITFPNGVPTVQDIKTNVGPVSQREAVLPIRAPPNPGGAAMLMPGSRASVHLPQSMINKRMSTDFGSVSLDNNPSPDVNQRNIPPGVVMRQRPAQQQQQQFHQQQQQQQQLQQHYRNSCYIEHQPQGSPAPKHVTQVTVSASPHESPHVKRPLSTAAANVIFRRKQNPPSSTSHSGGGVAKRCSGEFDFVRHNHRASLVLLDAPEGNESDVVRVRVRDGSQPSPDLVVNRVPDPGSKSEAGNRLPGLGRRAITQINIRHSKKNSYNAAICKSTENLVKVRFRLLRFSN